MGTTRVQEMGTLQLLLWVCLGINVRLPGHITRGKKDFAAPFFFFSFHEIFATLDYILDWIP